MSLDGKIHSLNKVTTRAARPKTNKTATHPRVTVTDTGYHIPVGVEGESPVAHIDDEI